MQGNKQPVHVEDRQCMNQHVSRLPAPVVFQHLRVAQHVSVRQHRALAAASGAAGVQNGCQVIGLGLRYRVLVAAMRGTVQQ